jgi:hypothetical protein
MTHTSVTLTSEVLNTAMQYYSWQEIGNNKDGLVSSAGSVSYWYAWPCVGLQNFVLEKYMDMNKN